MKGLLLFVLMTACIVACGNEKRQTPTTDSKGSGDDMATNGAPKSVAPKPVKAAKPLDAKGKTADEKPVALTAQVVDSSVTGKMTVDTHKLAVQGILDGKTLRCWLNSTDNSTFRGNMIGTSTGAGVQADFIISSSAGEKVIKGRLGE